MKDNWLFGELRNPRRQSLCRDRSVRCRARGDRRLVRYRQGRAQDTGDKALGDARSARGFERARIGADGREEPHLPFDGDNLQSIAAPTPKPDERELQRRRRFNSRAAPNLLKRFRYG